MKYAIGIDLGGSSIKYGIITEDGCFISSGKLPSLASESAEAVIGQLKKACMECLTVAGEKNMTLAGIGIGTPGITDDKNRIVIGGAENINGWENIPLSDILEKEFKLPVRVANDANMMGLGEQAFGAARNCSDVLFITVGTGIGGAIIIDGKLYGGYKNRGTEIGHIPFIANGDKCACGSVGCFETYASTSALVRRYIDRCNENRIVTGDHIDGEYIVNLYKQGDSLARCAIEEHCSFLGHGIAGLINIFSPQKVVIGGGISESGDFYLSLVNKAVNTYVIKDCAVNTTLCIAQLGNKAGTLGAAGLIFNELTN